MAEYDEAQQAIEEDYLPRRRVDQSIGTNPVVPSAPADAEPLVDFNAAQKAAAPRRPIPPALSEGSDLSEQDSAALENYRQSSERFDAKRMLAAQRAQRKELNATSEATLRTDRVQQFVDATGAVQPVRDAAGNIQYRPGKGPVQYDESGRAVQTQYDTSGPKQVQLDKDAPIGTHPDRPGELYRQNKHSPWEYLGTVADGLQSKDKNIQDAAKDAQLGVDKVLHGAAGEVLGQNVYNTAEALKSGAAQIQTKSKTLTDLNARLEQLNADPRLNQTEGGFLGIGSHPTSTALAMREQRDQLSQQIDSLAAEGITGNPKLDLGKLKDAKAAHAAATAERSAWGAVAPKTPGELDQILDERRTQLIANGQNPNDDPVISAVEKKRNELGLTPKPKPAADIQDPLMREHVALQAEHDQAAGAIEEARNGYEERLAPIAQEVQKAQAQMVPLQAQATAFTRRLETLVGASPGASADELSQRLGSLTNPETRARAQTIIDKLEPIRHELGLRQAEMQPLVDAHQKLALEANLRLEDLWQAHESELAPKRDALTQKFNQRADEQSASFVNGLLRPPEHVYGPSGGHVFDKGEAAYHVNQETGRFDIDPNRLTTGLVQAKRDGYLNDDQFKQAWPGALALEKAALGSTVAKAQAARDKTAAGAQPVDYRQDGSRATGEDVATESLLRFYGGAVGFISQFERSPVAKYLDALTTPLTGASLYRDKAVQFLTKHAENVQKLYDPSLSREWHVHAAGFLGAIAPAMLSGPADIPLLAGQGYQAGVEHAQQFTNDQGKQIRAGIIGGIINSALAIVFRSAKTNVGAPATGATSKLVEDGIDQAWKTGRAAGVIRFLDELKDFKDVAGQPLNAAALGKIRPALEKIRGELQTAPLTALKNIGGTMLRDSAIGAGVTVAQNVAARDYNPDQDIWEGAFPSAVEFGAFGGLAATVGAARTLRSARRDSAAFEQFAKSTVPSRFGQARPGLSAGGQESGQGVPTPGPITPEDVSAAYEGIGGLRIPNATPEQHAATQDALSGLVKIAGGKSIDSLSAAERAAIESDTPDGIDRVQIVKGKPVITQGTLDRVADIAPAVRKILPESEEAQRQAILNPVEKTAPESGSVEATSSQPNQKTGDVSQPTAEGSQNVPRGTNEPQLTEQQSKVASRFAQTLQARGVGSEVANAFAQRHVATNGTVGGVEAVHQAFQDAGGKFITQPDEQHRLAAHKANQELLSRMSTFSTSNEAAKMNMPTFSVEVQNAKGETQIIDVAAENSDAAHAKVASSVPAGSLIKDVTQIHQPEGIELPKPDKTALTPADFVETSVQQVRQERGGSIAADEEHRVRTVARVIQPHYERWQKAFNAVQVSGQARGSGGAALVKNRQLLISVPDVIAHAAQFAGNREHAANLVTEEAIHAVTTHLEDRDPQTGQARGPIDLVKIYSALPAKLQAAMKGAYKVEDATDYQYAHEFWRMFMQGQLELARGGKLKLKGKFLQEQSSRQFVVENRKVLATLMRFFRNMEGELRRSGSPEDVISEVGRAQNLIQEKVKEVDAHAKPTSEEVTGEEPGRTGVSAKSANARGPPENEPTGTQRPGESIGSAGGIGRNEPGSRGSPKTAAGAVEPATTTQLAGEQTAEQESAEIAAAARALKRLQLSDRSKRLQGAVAAARSAKIPVNADGLVRYVLSGRFDEPVTAQPTTVQTARSAATAEVAPTTGEQPRAEGGVQAGTVPVERGGERGGAAAGEPAAAEPEQPERLGDSITLGGQHIAVAGEWKTKNPRGSEVFTGKWALVTLRLLKINTQRGAAQDRIDRERTGAAQRLEIINNLTPENVDIAWGASPTLNDGAPIITPAGSVEVGNNRAMAIRDMFADQKSKAEIYEKWARDEANRLGLDAAQFVGEPIALVRVAEPNRAGLTQQEFVQASNTAATEQRSVAETALADRQVFSDPTLVASLDPRDDGSFNREFLTGFYNAVGAPKELRFEDGAPDDAKIERRAQAALLAHLLGRQSGVDRVLSSLMDNINTPGIRQVVSGLSKAGPAIVAAESINPSLSISANLGRALTSLLDYRRAKDAGEVRNVGDYLSQQQLIPAAGAKADPLDERLLGLLAEARSVKQVSDPLLRYAKAVEDYGDPKQQRFFGDDEPPSAAAVLAAQKTSDDREMLWDVAQNKEAAQPTLERDPKQWAQIYRKLFPVYQEGKLTPQQRALFDQAEAALGQKLLFGDETKAQQSLAQFKAKWTEGPIQGGDVQSQEGLFDQRGTVGRIPEGENQGLLFAQRTNIGHFDFGTRGLELFDRLPAENRAQAVEMAERNTLPSTTNVPASGQKVPELTESELPLGDVDASAPTQSSNRESGAAIRDFGEKIGGARKDLAEKTGPKSGQTKNADERPSWMRKYHVFEDAARPGEWAIGTDDRRLATRESFPSKEAAEAAIPLLEVSRNHSVRNQARTGEPDNYAITREVGPRKRPVVKDGFASREDAMQYMAQHPEEIINHKFAFPDKPWLDRIERTGPDVRTGNVTPAMFQEKFGFRGGEFGNWNVGSDGQAALNHAYEALSDLADTLAVDPNALSLNGDLAIAFGARGHGLEGARAHYERDYAVINLTKIKGAGSAAHEWFHAFDHYLARQDTKASSEKTEQGTFKVAGNRERDYVSHGFGYKSQVRQELRDAFKAVMDAMVRKNVTGEIDHTLAQKNESRMSEHVVSTLRDLRNSMEKHWQYSRAKKPPTPDQLARWDALAAKVAAGDVGKSEWIPGQKKGGFGGRQTLPELEQLNEIYKDVLGRSFMKSDPSSQGSYLYWQIKSMLDARERVKQAGAGATEVKSRPTDYFRNAREIDNFRATDYWSTMHELGARSFEAFVSDKLAAEGRRSDYLVHGADNRFYAALGLKPYPEGEERATLDSLWQHVFDVIKQQPTQRGVALYAQPTEQTAVDAAKSPSERFKDALPLAMDIAAGYRNISGVSLDDVQQHARIALARASKAYDPSRGPFRALARTAINNELRGLYRTQSDLRNETSLDAPSLTTGEPEVENLAGATNVRSDVERDEGRRILTESIGELPQRMQDAISGILEGRTLDEIGAALGGISKQAVGRLATEAMRRLRGKLGEKGISKTSDLLSQSLRYEGRQPRDYDKSSTQVTLAPQDARPFVEFANSIPEKEIYRDPDDPTFGRETEPHVTALYGITQASPKDTVSAVVGDQPKEITATVGKLSVFQTPKYDVLKAEITSPDLRAVNAALRKSVPFENDFPDYTPHLTIAYLKKGQGAKYVGDKRFEGTRLRFTDLDFRSKDGRKFSIDLTRSPQEALSFQTNLFQQMVEAALKAQETEDPVDQLMTMLQDDPLDILRGLAGEETPGRQTLGRPDLALGNLGAEMRAVHEFHTDSATPQTIEAWDAEAERLLQEKPDFGPEILQRWADGLPLTPPEVRAAQRWIINQQGQPKSGIEQERYDAAAYAYTKIGEATARSLAARRDPLQTPAERARDFLAKALVKLDKKQDREIAALTDQQKRVAAVEQAVQDRRNKINAALESIYGKGVSLDDVLQGEAELRLRGAPIVQNIVGGFDEASRKAFKLIQGGELTFDQIAKRTGLTPQQVEAVRDKFVAEFREKHFAKFKAGLKAGQVEVQGPLLAQSSELQSQSAQVSDEEAEAQFQRALQMMGVVPKDNQGTMKVVKRKRPIRSSQQQSSVPPTGTPPATGTVPYPAGQSAPYTGRVLGQPGLPLYPEMMIRKGFDLGSVDDVSKIGRIIAAAANGNRFDILYELWLANILSGPTTHFSYKLALAANMGMEFTIQRGVEALVNLAYRDSKSAQLGEFKAMVQGLLPGVTRGLGLAIRQFNSEAELLSDDVLNAQVEAFPNQGPGRSYPPAISETPFSQFLDVGENNPATRAVTQAGKAIDRTLGKLGKFNPARGRVIRLPMRVLYFVQGFYSGLGAQLAVGPHAYRQAKAEGLSGDALSRRITALVTTPNSTAWQRAVEESDRLTFQQPIRTKEQGGNALENAVALFIRARSGSHLIGTQFPFVQLPFNLVRTGIRKTPLGSFAFLWRLLKSGFFKLKDGKPVFDSYPAAEQVRHLAEQAIAWTTSALIWNMIWGDDDDANKLLAVTGSMPRSDVKKGERELYERAYGGPYQIIVGGRNGLHINYGKYEPAATVLGTVADTIHQLKSLKRGEQNVADTLGGIWSYFVSQVEEKTFLRGMRDIHDAIGKPAEVAKVIEKQLTQALVPNLIRQPLRNFDQYVRDYKSAGPAYLATAAGNLAQPKIDLYGRPVEKQGNAFSRMFFQAGTKPDPELQKADQLFLNYMRHHPNADAALSPPTVPPATYKDASGRDVPMTAEQKTKFLEAAGKRTVQMLRGQVRQRQIDHPTEDDVKAVKKIFEEAHSQIKREMFSKKRVNVITQLQKAA